MGIVHEDQEERVRDWRYRGMNPKFVHTVWEKRRREEAKLSSLEREHLREAAKADAKRARIAQQFSIRKRVDVELEKARKEEIFQAEFLNNVAHLRMSYMVEKYKSANAVDAMEVRYRASEIIRNHVKRSPYSYSQVMSNIRTRPIVAVRQAAMADVYVLCPRLSLPLIGKLFGGRDHTTVLHAVMKMGVWRGSRAEHRRSITLTEQAA